MQKGIFLGDRKQVDYVYPSDVRIELMRICGLGETVYTKEEILGDPARFSDIAYLFSTFTIFFLFVTHHCNTYIIGQSFCFPLLKKDIKYRIILATVHFAVGRGEYIAT